MEGNYKFCSRCHNKYDTSPFRCMLANGERADAEIEVYGEKYNLCQECAYKLWQFLSGLDMI